MQLQSGSRRHVCKSYGKREIQLLLVEEELARRRIEILMELLPHCVQNLRELLHGGQLHWVPLPCRTQPG